MKRVPLFHIDYNSHSGLPSQSAPFGEGPLSPFAAVIAFLVGLGVITMAVVTFVMAQAH
jgi:hypothetical protein